MHISRCSRSFSSAIRNTDDNLWLEYRAPIEMYLGTTELLDPVERQFLQIFSVDFFLTLMSLRVYLRAASSIVRRYPERHYLLTSVADQTDLPADLRSEMRAMGTKALTLHSAREQNEARFIQARAYVRASAMPMPFHYMRVFWLTHRGISTPIECWPGR